MINVSAKMLFEKKHNELLSVKNQMIYNINDKNQQLTQLMSYFDKVYFHHNQLYNYVHYLFSVTRVKASAFDKQLIVIKRKMTAVQSLIKLARKGRKYQLSESMYTVTPLTYNYDCLFFEQYTTILNDVFFKKALGRDKWNKLSALVNAYENSLLDITNEKNIVQSERSVTTHNTYNTVMNSTEATEKVSVEFDIVALYTQMLLLHKQYPELYADFSLTCLISNEIIALGSSDYADTEMLSQLKDRFDHMIDRVECFKNKQKQDQLTNQVQAKLATFTADELVVAKKLLS